MSGQKLSAMAYVLGSVVILALHSGCSVPNLESPECGQSRDSVRQFYSWYLGTNADERAKRPEVYRRFISPSFAVDSVKEGTDPYLLATDFPKTFKVGKCEAVGPDKVILQVQLYWRTEAKTTQKDVRVETTKAGENWLINRVSN
jgi:hypothetical protein